MRAPIASDSPPPVVSADVASDAWVRADTLALLIRQSFPALFQSLVIAGILCWTLWGRVETFRLLSWLGVLGATAVIRLCMYLVYFRVKPVGQAILVWEWPYAATLLLSSLTWGVGVL